MLAAQEESEENSGIIARDDDSVKMGKKRLIGERTGGGGLVGKRTKVDSSMRSKNDASASATARAVQSPFAGQASIPLPSGGGYIPGIMPPSAGYFAPMYPFGGFQPLGMMSGQAQQLQHKSSSPPKKDSRNSGTERVSSNGQFGSADETPSPGGSNLMAPGPHAFPGGHPPMMMPFHSTFVMNRQPALPQHQVPYRGIALALPCDMEQLSDYQILVRQQLELFEATQVDVECNTQGRKKPIFLKQVGLRCRHCAGLPLRARGRGAVYYPAKLQGVYQAAQNMAGSHLCNSCQQIPMQLKEEIKRLRERRDNASGGKQYWADGCRALGLYETEQGLRLGHPPTDD